MAATDSAVTYPLNPVYCGVCGMPPDLCEYAGPASYEKCKAWAAVHAPQYLPAPATGGAAEGADGGAGVAGVTAALAGTSIGADGAAAGGAAGADGSAAAAAPPAAAKPVKKAPVAKVYVEVKERGRKRFVTTITGLEAYGVTKLKDAASALGKRFGAGATVGKCATNPNIAEIDVQGDVAADLPDVLKALFGVPGNAIVEK